MSSPGLFPGKALLSNGFTLLELTFIVLIIGLIAAVISPDFAIINQKKLDVAAYKVAESLRYARNEAVHNNALRGVLVDTDNTDAQGRDITVFIPDTSSSPFAMQSILIHPVNKHNYDFKLAAIPSAKGVSFASTALPFSFQGVSGNKKYLFFNASGAPVYLDNNRLYRFLSGNIQIQYDGLTRTIAIQPITGKISVL